MSDATVKLADVLALCGLTTAYGMSSTLRQTMPYARRCGSIKSAGNRITVSDGETIVALHKGGLPLSLVKTHVARLQSDGVTVALVAKA